MKVLRGRRIPWLELAILVASIATLAIVQSVQKPADEAPSDTFSSYDTAPRGYRALFDLLQAEGIRVHRWERHVAFLDSGVDTLVEAPPDTQSLFEAEVPAGNAAQIDSWVRAGGRYVLLQDPGYALTSALDFPYTYEKGETAGKERIGRTLRAAGVRDVGSIGADTRWKTKKGVRTLYNDGLGPVIISYKRGAGTVIGIIDPDFFTDGTLGDADRGRLALALLRPGKPGGEVWFDETLHGHEVVTHWWEIVPLPFRIAAVIGLVCFLIALAGAAIRLGPPLLPVPRDDRTSADFIDALATLMARGGARTAAAQDAAASATSVLERALGVEAGTPEAVVASRISDATRRDEYRELRSLSERPILDSPLFVRTVALAQRLRKDPISHAR